jgi:tRNA threonylcarbamoyladenosine biosynthesis protein TsaB
MSIYILCIDTALSTCSVAVAKNSKVLGFAENKDANSASEQINILIDNALKQANISLKTIQAIALSNGPGSYTGLRIGAAVAKGIAYALDIPVIALPTLEIMTHTIAADFPDADCFIPNIDARRNEAYIAVYNRSLELTLTSQPYIIDEYFKNLFNFKHKNIFFGNASDKIEEVLKEEKNCIFAQNFTCNANDMIPLAYKKYLTGSFENTAYFEPDYTKPFFFKKKLTGATI